MKYEVKYIHIIERHVTCTVEADSEEEAIRKGADEGDVIDTDEDCCPDYGLEIRNKRARLIEGISEDLRRL